MMETRRTHRLSFRDAAPPWRPHRWSLYRDCIARALLLALLPLLALMGCAGDEAPPETKPRLVLIGIDGGSWNLIDAMIADGELPHLAGLAERGATADLRAVEPLNSPTVWTSLATGRAPDAHGVKFFYADRRSVQVPTVWERLAAAGLRVGLYEYLVTWPPRPLPGGFMVPGWLRRDERVQPADLDQRLDGERYSYSMDGIDGPDAIVANVEGEISHKAATWNRLMEAFALDVGAVVFYSVDAVSHRFWHASFPDEFDPPVEAAPRFAEVIHRTMRGVDEAIGEILERLEPEDHVVVVSDHGFRARGLRRFWAVRAPELLARLEVEPEGVTVVKNWGGLVLRLDPGPEAEKEEALGRLMAGLTSLRSTTGDPLFDVQAVRVAKPDPDLQMSRWMQGMVKQAGPAHAVLFVRPMVPVLNPIWPDGEILAGEERLPLRELAVAHDFSGDHLMDGIFLAAGKAIRHRPERGKLSVLDVAPLLSYLAGQPIPDDVEGQLDPDLIDPLYLATHPPQSVTASELPALPAVAPDGQEGEGDEELDERLRSLGYI